MSYEYRLTETYKGVRLDKRGHTEAEVIAKIERAKAEIDADIACRHSSTTVSAWWKLYKERYIEGKVVQRTEDDRERIFNNKIKPFIGSMSVSTVKPSHCQAIINNMAGHSKDYIDKTCQLLFNLFKRAKAEKMITSNPAEDLSRPPAEDGTGRPLTMQERALLLQIAADGHRAGLWLKCMIYTGMRPGETDNFKGCHINYDERLVYICGTKSEAAKRIVPIPDELAKELAALNLKPDEYVFKNSYGEKMQKSSRHKMWKSLIREMNIRAGCEVYRNQVQDPVVPNDCVPYCCRHTFATDIKDAGIPFRIRQEILGHANTSVTDRYSHRTITSLKKAANLLDKFRKEQMNDIRKEQSRFSEKGWDGSVPASEDLAAMFFPDM